MGNSENNKSEAFSIAIHPGPFAFEEGIKYWRLINSFAHFNHLAVCHSRQCSPLDMLYIVILHRHTPPAHNESNNDPSCAIRSEEYCLAIVNASLREVPPKRAPSRSCRQLGSCLLIVQPVAARGNNILSVELDRHAVLINANNFSFHPHPRFSPCPHKPLEHLHRKQQLELY